MNAGAHGEAVRREIHAFATAALFQAWRKMKVLIDNPLDDVMTSFWNQECVYAAQDGTQLPKRVKARDLSVLDELPREELDLLGCIDAVTVSRQRLRFGPSGWRVEP